MGVKCIGRLALLKKGRLIPVSASLEVNMFKLRGQIIYTVWCADCKTGSVQIIRRFFKKIAECNSCGKTCSVKEYNDLAKKGYNMGSLFKNFEA